MAKETRTNEEDEGRSQPATRTTNKLTSFGDMVYVWYVIATSSLYASLPLKGVRTEL